MQTHTRIETGKSGFGVKESGRRQNYKRCSWRSVTRGSKECAEDEAACMEEGQPGAVRGGDGMQIMDMEMDISDGHAVWA